MCLAKTINMFFLVHVGIDAVNVMAAYQPAEQAYGSEWRQELSECYNFKFLNRFNISIDFIIVCNSWDNKKCFNVFRLRQNHFLRAEVQNNACSKNCSYTISTALQPDRSIGVVDRLRAGHRGYRTSIPGKAESEHGPIHRVTQIATGA